MRVLVGIFLILLVIFPTTSNAEETEYIEYTVKKGDTLWDISGGNLDDPFFWPKIWKENPQIKNPDLIYPGQRIRIPKDLLQQQVELPPPPVSEQEAAVREEAEAETEPAGVQIEPRKASVVDPDLLASSGYIDTKIEGVGHILSTPTGRTIVGKNDDVYIQVNNKKPEKGTKYYIIRSLGTVVHPVEDRVVGEIIQIVGTLEVVGEEAGYTKAKILKSFSEIQTGYVIDEYYPIEPYPLKKLPAEGIHGTVIASRDLRILNGRYDIVYLDKGSLDGIKIGTVFTIMSAEPPRRPIAKVQVISTRQHTSVAMVIESEMEVARGDYF